MSVLISGRLRRPVLGNTLAAVRRQSCVRVLVGPLLGIALAGCGPNVRATGERTDASTWRPFVLASASEVAVPAPGRPGNGARAVPLDVVSPWVTHALRSVAQHTKNPPAASRTYGLMSIAMHDATIAAAHWRRVHGAGYPSTAAAIAGAASRVLADAFPEEPRSRLDAEAERLVAREPLEAAEAGLALGRRIAAKVVAAAASDEPARPWRGRVPRGPGKWRPPPGSTARPTAPLAATWKTWLLPEPSAVRPSPPPAYGSPAYVSAAREVVRVGRALTPEQEAIAHFWAGGEATGLPPGIWNQVALQIARDRRLGTERSVRMFALLNVAMADAGVAVWDAKYAYWTARPVNAIADLAIARDWQPLLTTPSFPSYPSGHSAFSAAAGAVLAHLFPDQAGLFEARAAEAAMSRLYGGLHFRFDNEAGMHMGLAIGRRAIEWDRAP